MKRSISGKITGIILPIFLVAMVALTGISYYSVNSIINNQVQNQMKVELSTAKATMNTIFSAHGKLTLGLAKTIEANSGVMNKEQYVSLLKKLPSSDADTFGMGVWFEPYKFQSETQFYGPYSYKDKGSVVYTDDYSKPEYNYPAQDWYKNGLDKNKNLGWSLPYFDPVTHVTMITATAHFLGSDGEIRGVVTGDMDLTNLQKNVSDMKIGKTGKAFLVDKSGLYIVCEDTAKIMKLKIQDEKNPSLAAVGKLMTTQPEGETTLDENGQKYRVYFSEMPDSHIIIGIKISEDELLGPAKALLMKSIAVTAVFIFLTGIIAVWTIGRAINPLKAVVENLMLISRGDLTTSIDSRYTSMNDEAGAVSSAVNEMHEALRVLVSGMKVSAETMEGFAKELIHASSTVSEHSKGVMGSMKEIAFGSQSQAEDLMSITAKVSDFGEAMDSMVLESREIDRFAKDISSTADKNTADMQQLIQSIDRVQSIFGNFMQLFESFREHISKINGITVMINSIADQTNLLALNASIEAARAGEHGRGFAVVAEEIRKLAEQSKASSENIKDIIVDVSGSIQNIGIMSENMGTEINDQTVSVNSAIASYDEIIRKINNTIPKIESINGSIGSLGHSKQEIAERIESVSAVSEEVSASTEEIVTMTHAMDASAQSILPTAERFEVMSSEMVEKIRKFTL